MHSLKNSLKHIQNLVFLTDVIAYQSHQTVYAQLPVDETLFLLLDLDVVPFLPAGADYLFFQDLIAADDQHLKVLDLLQAHQADFYPALKKLAYSGVSIWEIVKETFFYAQKPIFLTSVGLQKLAVDYTWEALYVATGLKHPVYLNTGGVFEADSIQAAMAHFSVLKGCEVHWLSAPEIQEASNQYIRHIVAETNLGEQYSLPDLPIQPALSRNFFKSPDKPCILFVGNSTCVHDAGLLFDTLKSSEDYNFIYLSTQHLFTYEQSDHYLGLDFRLLYTWPFLDSSVRLAYRENIAQALKNTDATYRERYPLVLDNPFLAFQTTFFEEVCEEAVNLIAAAQVLIRQFSPQLLIYGYGHITKDVAAVIEAYKQTQGKSVHLLHGSYLSRKKLSTLPSSDFIFVRGKQFAASIDAPKHQIAQVCTIGDLRKESALPQKRRVNSSASQILKPRILILSNRIFVGTNIDYLTHFSFEKYRQSFLGLIEMAERRTDLDFAWKPHPRHDYINYYKTINQQHISFYGREAVLLNLLQETDVCILLNSFSGSMVEAALAEVPTLQLRTAFADSHGIHDGFIHRDQVCHSLDELEQALDDLLSNPTIREQNVQRVLEGQAAWCDEVGYQALQRALQVIDDLNLSAQPMIYERTHAEHAAVLERIFAFAQLHWQFLCSRDQQTYQHQVRELLSRYSEPIFKSYLKNVETWSSS